MSKLIHRPYWKCYFAETDAIIYVVDAADVDRAAISKAELALVLEEEDLKGCALLVLANKQDLPGALNSQELSRALGLSSIRGRLHAVFNTSAIQGQGLFEGLDWLVTAVQKPKGSSVPECDEGDRFQ